MQEFGNVGCCLRTPAPGACARYVSTPAFAAHDKDARKQRAAADAAKRKAEAALVALHKRQAALAPPQAAARDEPGAAQAGTSAGVRASSL